MAYEIYVLNFLLDQILFYNFFLLNPKIRKGKIIQLHKNLRFS